MGILCDWDSFWSILKCGAVVDVLKLGADH